jgi:hypothetical protein
MGVGVGSVVQGVQCLPSKREVLSQKKRPQGIFLLEYSRLQALLLGHNSEMSVSKNHRPIQLP